MANKNDGTHNKTSRLNTPRGSAGSSRQRDHVSNVRGRYANLDASSVNGSWAQRAAEARRANEQRARNSSRTSEYEQRAREARNRQFETDSPAYARPAERSAREERASYTRDLNNPVERLYSQRTRYEDGRADRFDRRTVQLGSHPELEYEQRYDSEEYDVVPDEEIQDGFEPEYGDDGGFAGRVRNLIGDIGGFVRGTSLRARIIAIAVIVLVLVFIIHGVLTGGSHNEKNDQMSSTSASTSASASVSSSSAAIAVDVEDPWVSSGVFTTGDAELDRRIKALCDSESEDGASAAENAYRVYVTVAWSDYVERDDNQDPQGADWALTYAKQWFANGDSGNNYEFAAVIQYVMQYFGYTDAYAQACRVKTDDADEWNYHGLVFLTDISSGDSRVIDEALGTNGWMLDKDALTYEPLDAGQNA